MDSIGGLGENALFFGQFTAGILAYVVISVSLFVLANRKKEEFSWFAFVPLLNLLLLCKIGKVNPFWLLTFLFPPVGVFVAVWILMRVASACGKSWVWGILMAVPCVQLVAWPLLAAGAD